MKHLREYTLPALALAALFAAPAHAVSLIDGLGGEEGFGELAMTRNDDGSSNELDLPFSINFYGQQFDSFWINNNGNVTFNGPESSYTPNAFPSSNSDFPMIAPYWADVDTRCTSCGEVYIGSGQTTSPNDTVVVTWNDVGYYSSNADKTNNFQLVLRDRSDTGAGNFDVDFRYDRLEWTTGDASGGTNGLGGTPAQAGYDAGDNSNYFTLPGSRTADVLDLQDTSNVSSSTPGLWTFAIRNGSLPGSDPSNPLLPVTQPDGSFSFDFNVDLDQQVFIDPPVAIGYEYEVQSGPNFASVEVPTALPGGDAVFDLILPGFDDPFTLNAGEEFDLLGLNAGGFSNFEIRGIDVDEGLDPSDPLAFVTGLTFVSGGDVSMTQTPITVNVEDGTVPVPATMLLMVGGLLGLGISRGRHRGYGN